MALPPAFAKKPADDAPEKPADDKGPGPGASADAMLDEAESGGKLEPIKAMLAEVGRDDIDAKEVLKLAQKDDRTHGKPVEEIAKMLTEDETLLDDLMEYREGGMFTSRGMGKKPPAEKDENTDEAEKPADMGGGMPPGMM